MTVDYAAAATSSRELEAVGAELHKRFPGRRRDEIDLVVAEVYQQFLDRARVRDHLIPLTLNRCRRLLSEDPRPTTAQTLIPRIRLTKEG